MYYYMGRRATVEKTKNYKPYGTGARINEERACMV